MKRGKNQKEGGNSQEELFFAFFSEQKLLEGIANSEVQKVTSKVVTSAVDAGVSDSAASTMLVSRKVDSDAAQEFYALLALFLNPQAGGGRALIGVKVAKQKKFSSAYQLPIMQRFCTCYGTSIYMDHV